MQERINMEERIQDYIDGICNETESIEVAKYIASSQLWKETYVSLMELHTLLQTGFEPMEPSMRFSKNVMEQIGDINIAKATRQYLNPKVIWAFGILFAGILVLLLGYSISLADWTSTGSDVTFKVPEIPIPSVNWEIYINSKTTMIFLFINIVLGLSLLDYWLPGKRNLNSLKRSFK
jgi:hypothetical protein